jgi:hypothetical protein
VISAAISAVGDRDLGAAHLVPLQDAAARGERVVERLGALDVVRLVAVEPNRLAVLAPFGRCASGRIALR